MTEILVLTQAEPEALHVDTAAETGVVLVEEDQSGAFPRGEHGDAGLRPAPLPERPLDRVPVEPFEAGGHAGRGGVTGGARPFAPRGGAPHAPAAIPGRQVRHDR